MWKTAGNGNAESWLKIIDIESQVFRFTVLGATVYTEVNFILRKTQLNTAQAGPGIRVYLQKEQTSTNLERSIKSISVLSAKMARNRDLLSTSVSYIHNRIHFNSLRAFECVRHLWVAPFHVEQA